MEPSLDHYMSLQTRIVNGLMRVFVTADELSDVKQYNTLQRLNTEQNARVKTFTCPLQCLKWTKEGKGLTCQQGGLGERSELPSRVRAKPQPPTLFGEL
jgi:hypothetical protein